MCMYYMQQQLLCSSSFSARLTTQSPLALPPSHRPRGQLILSPREGKKLLNGPRYCRARPDCFFYRKSRVITRPRAPPQFTPRITREMDVSQTGRSEILYTLTHNGEQSTHPQHALHDLKLTRYQYRVARVARLKRVSHVS